MSDEVEEDYWGKGDPYWDWTYQAEKHFGLVEFSSMMHPLSHWSKRSWIGYRNGNYGFNINEGGRHCSGFIIYSLTRRHVFMYFSIRWWGKWHRFYKFITI